MKLIRKHPIAFFNLVGFTLIGISFLFIALDPIAPHSYDWIIGLMFVVGAAVLLITVLIGVVIYFVRKAKNAPSSHELSLEDRLALDYMTTKYDFLYGLLILLFSPVLPLILVPVIDMFMLPILAVNIGLLIWLLCTHRDWLLLHFYKVRNCDKYFELISGEDGAVLDELYGDYVHVIREESWDDDCRNFICNLLKHCGTLPSTIKCYRVSNDFLSRNYDYKYNSYLNQLILIPFSQFRLTAKYAPVLRKALDSLSFLNFTPLVDSKYGHKSSLSPEDYANNEIGIALRPFAANIKNSAQLGSDTFICFDHACAINDQSKRYHDCLFVLRNAELLDDEDGVAAKQLVYRKGNYLNSFSIHEDEQIVELTIGNIFDVENYDRYDEDAAEDAPTFPPLRCRYEQLEWHWDGFCDISKTEAVFALANSSKRKRSFLKQ